MSASYKTMWGGGLAAFFGWLASLNWLGLIGTLIAIGGGAVNIYLNVQKHKREKIEHEAKMEALRRRAPFRSGDIPSGAEQYINEG